MPRVRKAPTVLPAKFADLFKVVAGDYRSIETRVVAARFRGRMFLLGGEVKFSSADTKNFKPWPRAFSNRDIAVLHSTAPAKKAMTILASLMRGCIPCGKSVVQLRSPLDPKSAPPPPPHPFEPVPRHSGNQLVDERFGLQWTLTHPEAVFTSDWVERAERSLSEHDFEDLRELLGSFIRGHQGGKSQQRRFEVAVPLLISGQLRSSPEHVVAELRVGPTVERSSVKAVVKGYVGGYVNGEKVFEASIEPAQSEWTSKSNGFEAERSFPVEKADGARMVVSYKGIRLTTSAITISLGPVLTQPAPPSATPSVKSVDSLAGLKEGEEFTFAVLDIDIEGSTSLGEQDPDRSRRSKERFHEICLRAISDHGGRRDAKGDENFGYFRGERRCVRAFRAALQIFFENESSFLAQPDGFFKYTLRGALHTGTTVFHHELGTMDSPEVNWVAKAQHDAGPAPRLSASTEFLALLPSELREMFAVQRDEFRGKRIGHWKFVHGVSRTDAARVLLDVHGALSEAFANPVEEVRKFAVSLLDPREPAGENLLLKYFQEDPEDRVRALALQKLSELVGNGAVIAAVKGMRGRRGSQLNDELDRVLKRLQP